MVDSFVERQIENAAKDAIGEGAVRIMRGVSKMAARQGGETTAQNYRLLGKRALIAAGAVVVVVQLTTSVVGLVVSRKSEEQRVERIVRRVLAEEREKQPELEAAAEQSVD